MDLTVGDRPIRPITADEAMEMASTGIIGPDERLELLHGVLTAVTQQHPPHAAAVQRLTSWLAPSLVSGAVEVRVQLPLRVPDETSLPEPDIAVVPPGDHVIDHPHTALLIIEVAHTSLHVDIKIKPPLYSAAEVPEYWIVDVKGRRLERLTDPSGAGYATHSTHAPPGSVQPPGIDVPPLDLVGLFRGL